jgi:hypothetical protein
VFTESIREIPKLGLSYSKLFECLGDVLSLLYAEASCVHGCMGGDHFWQRITARIVTPFLRHCGSLSRLLRRVTRSKLGTGRDPPIYFSFLPLGPTCWSVAFADDSAIGRNSRQPKSTCVGGVNLHPPVDKSRYGLLCEVGVHFRALSISRGFNEHGRPTLVLDFNTRV